MYPLELHPGHTIPPARPCQPEASFGLEMMMTMLREEMAFLAVQGLYRVMMIMIMRMMIPTIMIMVIPMMMMMMMMILVIEMAFLAGQSLCGEPAGDLSRPSRPTLVNIIYHRFMMIELMKIDFIFNSSRHDKNESSR